MNYNLAEYGDNFLAEIEGTDITQADYERLLMTLSTETQDRLIGWRQVASLANPLATF
jgi:hypothetical protein